MKTSKQILEVLVDRINELTGAPTSAWTDGKANIGNYHISYSCGGAELHRMSNTSGGIRAISHEVHSTKPKLDSALRHIITGLEIASES